MKTILKFILAIVGALLITSSFIAACILYLTPDAELTLFGGPPVKRIYIYLWAVLLYASGILCALYISAPKKRRITAIVITLLPLGVVLCLFAFAWILYELVPDHGMAKGAPILAILPVIVTYLLIRFIIKRTTKHDKNEPPA